MKKIVLSAMLSLAVFIVAKAKNPTSRSAERAKHSSRLLQKQLKLSNTQKVKLYEIFLDQVKKEDSLKRAATIDKLTKLRQQIDKIDYQILQRMAERMQVAQEIGDYKRVNHIGVVQANRWDEVMKKRNAFAQAVGLDTSFTTKLLELIHSESVRKQKALISSQD